MTGCVFVFRSFARRSKSLVGSAYRLTLRPAGAATETHQRSRTIGTTIGPSPWKPTEHRGPSRPPSARLR